MDVWPIYKTHDTHTTHTHNHYNMQVNKKEKKMKHPKPQIHRDKKSFLRHLVLGEGVVGCFVLIFETRSHCEALAGLEHTMLAKLAQNSQRSSCHHPQRVRECGLLYLVVSFDRACLSPRKGVMGSCVSMIHQNKTLSINRKRYQN